METQIIRTPLWLNELLFELGSLLLILAFILVSDKLGFFKNVMGLILSIVVFTIVLVFFRYLLERKGFLKYQIIPYAVTDEGFVVPEHKWKEFNIQFVSSKEKTKNRIKEKKGFIDKMVDKVTD